MYNKHRVLQRDRCERNNQVLTCVFDIKREITPALYALNVGGIKLTLRNRQSRNFIKNLLNNYSYGNKQY